MVKKASEVEILASTSKHLGIAASKRVGVQAHRFSVVSKPVAHREVVIRKGKGKALSEIPYIEAMLNKKKSTDPAVVALHRIAYGAPATHLKTKRNLREFSGITYSEKLDRAKLDSRISNKPINLLRNVCELVGLERSGDKADIEKRLVEFLEKPYDTEAKAPKSSPKKRKASSTTSPAKKGKGKKKAAKGSPKKKKAKKEGPKRPTSAFMYFSNEKRAEVNKKNPGLKVTEVAQKLGEMWRKQKDRSEWEQKALKDKKRYQKEKAEAEAAKK